MKPLWECRAPLLIGVRHHSPACAVRMPEWLGEFQPHKILLELPPELQEWLPWLAHPQLEAPVALAADSSFYPFADFSPELAALRWARTHGVEVEAFDLSVACSPPEELVPLEGGRESGVHDPEAFWDERVESMAPGASAEALRQAALLVGWEHRQQQAFEGMRRRDLVRETVMRQRLLEQLESGQRVACVVGAFHAAALLPEPLLWIASPPPLPRAAVRTSLVAYRFDLLDSRSGYPAGIRDPLWRQRVWESGLALDDLVAEFASELCSHLRDLRQAAGTPDARETVRMAWELSQLRGLPAPGRGEFLESVQSCMAQGELLGRGRALARALERTLVGTRRGRLAPNTPRSGLGPAVEQERQTLKLADSTPELRLDPLRSPLDRSRHIFLRRLQLLGIPYAVEREAGLTRVWSLEWNHDSEAALEMAGWRGPSLEQACQGALPPETLPALQAAAECALPQAFDQKLRTLTKEYPQNAGLPELVTAITYLERIARNQIPGLQDHPLHYDKTPLLAAAVKTLEALSGSDHLQDATALRDLLTLEGGGLRLRHALQKMTSPLMQGAATIALATLQSPTPDLAPLSDDNACAQRNPSTPKAPLSSATTKPAPSGTPLVSPTPLDPAPLSDDNDYTQRNTSTPKAPLSSATTKPAPSGTPLAPPSPQDPAPLSDDNACTRRNTPSTPRPTDPAPLSADNASAQRNTPSTLTPLDPAPLSADNDSAQRNTPSTPTPTPTPLDPAPLSDDNACAQRNTPSTPALPTRRATESHYTTVPASDPASTPNLAPVPEAPTCCENQSHYIGAPATQPAIPSQVRVLWLDWVAGTPGREMARRLQGALLVGSALLESRQDWTQQLLTAVAELEDDAFLCRAASLREGFEVLSQAARARFLEALGLEQTQLSLEAEQLLALAVADRAGLEALAGLDLPLPPELEQEESAAGLPKVRGHIPLSERFRLILGQSPETPQLLRAARALDELYGRGHGEGSRSHLGPGSHQPYPGAREWADDLEELFGAPVRQEVLGRAAERGRPAALLALDPEEVVPSIELLEQALSLVGALSEVQLTRLRLLVERCVQQLTQELSNRLRPSLQGLTSVRPSRRPGPRLDLPRTLRANLHTARHEANGWRLAPERLLFQTRQQRSLDWRIVLVVDVSGSMEASVIYSALMGAILAGLPALSVHFLAFSTEVIDFSQRVQDPLTLLMEVHVGGGTHIAPALRYARSLLTVPSRSLVVLVSDFEEGGPLEELLSEVRALGETGARPLGLAALNDQGQARYCAATAEAVVNAGMPVAALTPLELARWVAEQVRT